ncbi:MAG: type 1 glutamine amidotransferase [Dehalococcoidia bacterium]
MTLLVLQHVECEGPGYIEDFAAERGLEIEIVRLFDGEPIPDPGDFQAMIVMGGPMNVYEEEKYPCLVSENAAIQRAIRGDVPYLGICLGSQLLAKALGAPARRNPVKEIGFADISLTPEGRHDPLFQGFPHVVRVFHWHGDTWDVPPGGIVLASSVACPHQAFRYGSAYGIQFHVETRPEMVRIWIKEYESELRECGLWDSAETIAAEGEARADILRRQTLTLMTNFWDAIVARQATHTSQP